MLLPGRLATAQRFSLPSAVVSPMQGPKVDLGPSHLLVACIPHLRHIVPFLKALVPNSISRCSAVWRDVAVLRLFHALKTLWMKLTAPLAVTVLPLAVSPYLTRSPYARLNPNLFFFRGLPFF